MSAGDRPYRSYCFSAERELSVWFPRVPEVHPDEAQVIDFFCGCGGMTLGFEALGRSTGGFRIVGGVDVDKSSLSTFQRNFKVPAISADIRDVAFSDAVFRKTFCRFASYDPEKSLVLIGCAPCQGFTGHRKGKWAKPDERNDLISAFAEVAIRCMPEAVVMENVPELLSERYWSYFEAFRTKLQKNGYSVFQKILNSAEFGVPQERFRAVIVATKDKPFHMPSSIVDRKDFNTVRNAIGDLPPVNAGEFPEPDPMHRSAAHRKSTIDVIRAVPVDGGSRPRGVGPKCLDRIDGYYDVYGRLSWDRPSITITHYARNPASGRFVHPEQHRGLTKREVARLQSFPDGFQFEGSFDDVFRQVGEAVPPLVSASIAASILESLRGEASSAAVDSLVTKPVSNSFSGVIAGIKARRR